MRSRLLHADDQALRRDHHPTAVLTLDLLDPADARQMVARLDLDDAVAALDERRAAIGLAQYPAVHDAVACRLRCGSWSNRSGGFRRRSRRRRGGGRGRGRGRDVALVLVALELLDRFRDL